MKRPTEPKQEDCCNSGCNPCIFDVYEKQLRIYEKFKDSEEVGPSVENAISQLEYTEFCVIDNIDLVNDHKLIVYKNSDTRNEKQVVWTAGDHLLLKYLSKELNCTRAYTPIKLKLKDIQKYDFAIIVKRYSNGLVSNYLCNLNVGDISLWRGPYGNYKLIHNKFRRLIMIAQGTGITPLYSIINQVLDNEDDMSNIFLFYCCKNHKSILLRNELYSLKSYWNFNYEIYLGDKLIGLTKYKEPIIPQKLNFSDISKLKSFSESDQFLLCGSDTFMQYFKQSLAEENVIGEFIVTF